MKKLAVVVTHPIQYYSPLFAKLSSSGGIELKVFYTWSQAKGKKYDQGFGVEVDWDIPLLDGYDYRFVDNVARDPGLHHFRGIVNPGLVKEIGDWNADAVLVVGWNFQSHLRAMRYFKGKIPVYFRGDSTLLDEEPGLRRIARRISLRYVYSHVDYAFYVGTRNREYFSAHGLKEGQLVFAPHTIDNERFYDNDERCYTARAMEWRRSLGIKDNEIVFLFAGKLQAAKNPDILLEAFWKLNQAGSHLIYVGTGELQEEIRTKHGELARSHGDADSPGNVHFLPFQNQSLMPVVYRLGNVFVLPSRSETWGLAVNEAMASGLPVVLSDKVGCAADLVEIGKNGYIFRHNDVNELTSCLGDCMRMWTHDRARFKAMGSSSIRRIEQYRMETVAARILEAAK